MQMLRCIIVGYLAWATGACGGGVEVEYRRGHNFTPVERRTIESIASSAVHDVRGLLPGLPSDVRITVQAGTRVIPETGETGSVGVPRTVYWTVDPSYEGGVAGVAARELRGSLFHELYHLVRETAVAGDSLRDRVINEGLATAFERDFAGGRPPPWGAYPADAAAWAEELLAQPPDAAANDWMATGPDGQRWFGFKVGTYLADQAVSRSGLSLAELMTMPTDEVLALARSGPPVP